MNVIEILNNWGIQIPDGDWFLEYLCENKKDHIYYIDKLPFIVGSENAYKFDQVDIFYQQVFLKEASKDDFMKIELKYRNAMNKLWLYNKTFIEFILPEACYANPKDVVEENYKKYLSLLKSDKCKEQLFEVKQKEELEFWVQLGIRDILDIVFYLENYQAIIVPSWEFFIVYINDIDFCSQIKDIVTSEGLFLRH